MSRSPVMRRRIMVLRAWMRIEWAKAAKDKKNAGIKRTLACRRLTNRD